ncbi:hypothetical protein E2562_031811 [Oryza meyeriana var. granulata]|uniref:Uncharacterized protein n=1 Tax=Oryza meyeriana var. granulata TaxID=110450 RepID=A0A6G1EC52_9ORYZ|nr:hypothetical protein E2562_031811 [Oryza meyeriana var. granulata]
MAEGLARPSSDSAEKGQRRYHCFLTVEALAPLLLVAVGARQELQARCHGLQYSGSKIRPPRGMRRTVPVVRGLGVVLGASWLAVSTRQRVRSTTIVRSRRAVVGVFVVDAVVHGIRDRLDTAMEVTAPTVCTTHGVSG